MKKIISLLVCFVLLFSVCITASAAGTATLKGNTSVTVGNNIEFTVNVSGCGDASSAAVEVAYSENFELVSGTWLKSGALTKYDTDTNKGGLGGLNSPDVNGNVFKLVLKAKTVSATAQNVSITFIAKNGSNEIMNVPTSKAVKINCASHSYGNYTNANTSNHTRTCSACGNIETKAHTWNSGAVTKPASCKETGVKTYTCTATGCGATKTETIAKTTTHTFSAWTTSKEATCTADGQQKRTCSVCQKVETKVVKALGHSFSKPTVTKQPTCTETGIETGTCTRCKQATTNTIKALGHKFGEWAVKTAATCTAKGVEEHKCSACDVVETRDVEVLGHDFEDPKVVKEPTISETGIKQGKCKRCGEITEEAIPCTAKDETTGVTIEAEVGAFQEGTELKVEEIKEENQEVHKHVKTALKEVSEKFVAYDISTVLNGAKVQPNGKIKAIFKIPAGFSNELKVFFIGDDGSKEEQPSKVNEDGTITAELSHFSTYVICDVQKDASANAQKGLMDMLRSIGKKKLAVIGAAGLLLVAAAVVVIVLISKKKKATVTVE